MAFLFGVTVYNLILAVTAELIVNYSRNMFNSSHNPYRNELVFWGKESHRALTKHPSITGFSPPCQDLGLRQLFVLLSNYHRVMVGYKKIFSRLNKIKGYFHKVLDTWA